MGLDPNETLVSQVMTPNPSCVSPIASAMVALKTMVSGQFRHLPVADKGHGKQVYYALICTHAHASRWVT